MEIIFVLLGLGLLLVAVVVFRKSPQKRKDSSEHTSSVQSAKPKPKKKTLKNLPKVKHEKFTPKHELYYNSLSNFHSKVSDFDTTEGYLAAACQDGSINLFKFQGLNQKSFNYLQAKLERDEPSAIAINKAGNLVVTAGLYYRKIHLFAPKSESGKKTLQEVRTFNSGHTRNICGIGVSESCIVTCGEDVDTHVIFWGFDGTQLAVYNTNQLKNNSLAFQRDLQMLSVATWMGSARVIQMQTKKGSEEFEKYLSIMDLSGHSKGLSCIYFTPAMEAVTCSIDGTVKVWNINVKWHLKEDPKVLFQFKTSTIPYASHSVLTKDLLVLAHESRIEFYNRKNLQMLDCVEKAHGTNIQKISVYKDYLLSQASEGRINIWNLPVSS